MRPSVDSLVHYVPCHGEACLEAIITAIELTGVDLYVFHGVLPFHVCGVPRRGQPSKHRSIGEWHWPESDERAAQA
jgi:hypothetical protein